MTSPWIDPARFRRVLLRSIAIPLLVMSGLAVGLVYQINYLVSVNQEIARLKAVGTSMDVLRSLIADKETGLRGYLLTGSSTFLEPFRLAEQRFGPALAELETQLADEPEQLARLEQLTATWLEWDQYARTMMALRSAEGDYTSYTLSLQGRSLMERARTQRQAMAAALEARRIAQVQRAERASHAVIAVGVGMMLLLGAALAVFGRRQLLGLARSYERAIDLSDQHAAALRQSEQQFRSIFDAAQDAMVITDDSGKVVDANPATSRLFGRNRDGLVGQILEDEPFIAGARKPRGEFQLTRHDGTVRSVEYTAARNFLPGRHVSVLRDITERKQHEAEVRQLNETLEKRVRERTSQLEEANRELESFSYSVSHDLRSPLRHINGFSELLRRSAQSGPSDQTVHYLDTITDSARRASTLVDELLAFSRMGRTELRNLEVDMSALFEEVRREVEPESEGRKITWRVAALPKVRGDGPMLRLAVRNLLSNALKYTRRQPEACIEVDCSTQHGEFVFRVSDNGVGFDMEYIDRLFGVFKRLHRDDEFEGTGIGLANVRRIIQRHGGRTWAEGRVGEGATFYFSLPAVPPTAELRMHPEKGGEA